MKYYMAQLRAAFGLVWDGTSIHMCSGEYGFYVYNDNPHKSSLEK
jgi:hypothetical protein